MGLGLFSASLPAKTKIILPTSEVILNLVCDLKTEIDLKSKSPKCRKCPAFTSSEDPKSQFEMTKVTFGKFFDKSYTGAIVEFYGCARNSSHIGITYKIFVGQDHGKWTIFNKVTSPGGLGECAKINAEESLDALFCSMSPMAQGAIMPSFDLIQGTKIERWELGEKLRLTSQQGGGDPVEGICSETSVSVDTVNGLPLITVSYRLHKSTDCTSDLIGKSISKTFKFSLVWDSKKLIFSPQAEKEIKKLNEFFSSL